MRDFGSGAALALETVASLQGALVTFTQQIAQHIRSAKEAEKCVRDTRTDIKQFGEAASRAVQQCYDQQLRAGWDFHDGAQKILDASRDAKRHSR